MHDGVGGKGKGWGRIFFGDDFFKDNFFIFKLQYVNMHILAVVYDFSIYK